MLVYHFGTKDQLVREMLREARRRQRALVEDVLQPRPGTPYAVVLKDAWPIMISREVLPYFRLFRELHDLPERISPWKEFRTLAIRDWLPVAEAGLRSDGHAQPSAMATVLVAICRGLLLDLNVTGDDQRTTSAFNAFLELLPPARRSTSA
jgi:AcrR family transcriptional regulator